MRNIEKLTNWLKNTPYEGVFLGRRDNFKWITEENANAVVTNAEVGVAYLLIKKDGSSRMFADSSDSPRMKKEQNALCSENILVPWYEGVESAIAFYCQANGGKQVYASDTGIAETKCIEDSLVDLRMQLSEKEILRYREIGQQCAEIVERTTQEIQPGQTEKEVEAILKCRCIQAGISPDCVLIGSDDRILEFRHPVPTDKKIEKSAMVVLGGEKYGLNISMTRFIYFEEPSDVIKERMKHTQEIFVNMQCIMRHNMSYKEYFGMVKEFYKEAGYEDEWMMHHQGGPTGYGCREFVITPDTEGALRYKQAYAWNPTIQGTKCEETTILNNHGVECLTRTSNWPRRTVQTKYGDFDAADIFIVKK